MIRVMLVDDEPFIRTAVKTLFPWEQYGFQIISEASNGKKALEKLALQPVDMVITDIKMPAMDGISLIRQLKKNYPHIFCVVLSNYDDFTLTRNAFREGAVDYLLKSNLNIENFQSLIQRLQKYSASGSSADENTASAALTPEIHTWILEALAFGHPVSQELISQLEQDNPYVIASIKLGNPHVKAASVSDSTENFIKSTVKRIIHEISEFRLYTCAVSSKEYIFLIYCTENSDAFFSRLHNFFDLLTSNISMYLNDYTTAGISSLYSHISQIQKAYHSACGLSDNIFYARESLQYFADSFTSHTYETQNQIRKEIEQLSGIIHAQDWDALTQVFHRLLAEAEQGLYAPKDTIRLINNIEFLISNEVARIFSSDSDFLYEISLHKENTQIRHIDDLKEHVEEFLTHLLDFVSRSMSIPSNCSPIVTEAIKTLLDKYTDPETNLATVASHIAVNASYLSRIFFKETGQHFNAYLTFLRINQAKIQLRSTKDSVSMIAERCGYNNCKYFINIFKKIEGITPSTYREAKALEH